MKPSPRLLVAAIILILAIPAWRGSADGLSTLYSDVSAFFSADDNAGLTTFRSLLVPMGGLSEGMGMASTSVYRDSSYFEANPAASSLLDQTELAVYHNNWIADSAVESAVYTIRRKDLGFGLMGKWLYLKFPQTDQYGDTLAVGYYSEAILGLNISYNFFSGYNFSGLALGATLKGAYRAVPSVITDAAGNSAGAVMVDLGALIRFNSPGLKFYSSRNKNCAFGLAIKNLGPAVQGDPLPTVVSAGLSYSPIRPLLFSFDLSKYINLVDLSLSEKNLIWAFGVEGNLTNAVKMTGGFLLKGANPRLSLGSIFDLPPLSLNVNYTLDLTTQLRDFNRLSATVTIKLGDLGRADLAKKVDSLYLDGLEAYAKGLTAEARALWQEAVRLNPRFDPAIESLRALESAQRLLETMLKAQESQGKGK